jgi:hypothetical protein
MSVNSIKHCSLLDDQSSEFIKYLCEWTDHWQPS